MFQRLNYIIKTQIANILFMSMRSVHFYLITKDLKDCSQAQFKSEFNDLNFISTLVQHNYSRYLEAVGNPRSIVME